MRTRVLTSSPLRPIAESMRALAEACDEFWIATAFVDSGAVDDIVGHAVSRGARVRFLTGTFGHNTRRTTFRKLLAFAEAGDVDVCIWCADGAGNFHSKLYLWRLPGEHAVAWIGSANFTSGGLQNEGELLLEIRERWNGQTMRRLRKAFDANWGRGEPITSKFVDSYKEAPRPPPDFAPIGRGRRSSRRQRPRNARVFTSYVTYRYPDGSPVVARVETLLSGTAGDSWVRHHASVVREARPGDWCILVDLVDKRVALVELTDSVPDGKTRVFSYVPVLRRNAWIGWTKPLRRRLLVAAGYQARGPSLGSRWLSQDASRRVIAELYQKRAIPTGKP